MHVNVIHLFLVAGYVLLFIGALLGVAAWRKRRSDARWPVETKLRRGPGESLRRRTDKLWEDFAWVLYVATFAPLMLGTSVVWFLSKTAPTTRLNVALAIAATVTLAGLIITGAWALKRLRIIVNHRLGYFGERVVGEFLEPLLADGYRVFHDVPGEGREKYFNLDHVAVGPSGVTLIETKTRRKGRARQGFPDHEVSFDGQRLIWPWGEDRSGLDQAVRNADYLHSWIKQRTGLDVMVRPILTLPGWYVHEKRGTGIRVVNSKILSGVIRDSGDRVLSDEHIDLIARQLDVVCRDVEE